MKRFLTRSARLPVLVLVAAASGMVLLPTPAPSVSAASLNPNEIGGRLAKAYPDFVRVESNGGLRVRGQDVAVVATVSTGPLESRMAGATLGDQLSIPYPKGCPAAVPALDDDPGRLRHELFFRAMYGGTSAAVAKNLTSVPWFGSTMRVTTINGVDTKLAAVAKELAGLPEMRKYLTPPGGSFFWRKIAGENVLSMHSFGIAVDINTKYSDYWRWSGAGVKKYSNRIPCEIAEVFERHGFIWGAKWYHFDSMHFEYRPELLG